MTKRTIKASYDDGDPAGVGTGPLPLRYLLLSTALPKPGFTFRGDMKYEQRRKEKNRAGD